MNIKFEAMNKNLRKPGFDGPLKRMKRCLFLGSNQSWAPKMTKFFLKGMPTLRKEMEIYKVPMAERNCSGNILPSSSKNWILKKSSGGRFAENVDIWKAGQPKKQVQIKNKMGDMALGVRNVKMTKRSAVCLPTLVGSLWAVCKRASSTICHKRLLCWPNEWKRKRKKRKQEPLKERCERQNKQYAIKKVISNICFATYWLRWTEVVLRTLNIITEKIKCK